MPPMVRPNGGFLIAASSAAARLLWRGDVEGKFLPPDLVRAPVDKVFVPHGFDDNDDVELVLAGDRPP